MCRHYTNYALKKTWIEEVMHQELKKEKMLFELNTARLRDDSEATRYLGDAL